MSAIAKTSVIVGALVLGGCAPAKQSAVDSTASVSSTTTSVTSTPVDTPAAAIQATTTGAKTTAGASTTTKTTVTTTQKSSEAAPDPNIIGHDRVLRLPRRSLPTVSSTPQR